MYSHFDTKKTEVEKTEGEIKIVEKQSYTP